MTPGVIKVGVSVRADLIRVATAWGLSDFCKLLQNGLNSCYVELGQLAKLKGAILNDNADLAALNAVVLRCRIPKHQSLPFADWSMSTLGDDHQNYAALFAYAVHQIWIALSTKLSVNMPLGKAIRGQLVSLMSGKKIAAYGIVADQPAKVSVLVGSETKELKLTAKQAVITVQKVVLGGMLIKAQKLSLQELGPLPFIIVVPLNCLRTRSAEEPQEILSELPQVGPSPPYMPLPPFAEEVMSQNKFLDRDYDELEYLTDTDDDSYESIPAAHNDPMEIEFHDTSNTMEGTSGLSNMERDQPTHQAHMDSPSHATGIKPGYVQPEYNENTSLHTRVFEDIFHVMNRLLKLLSKAHSAFNPFAQQLSQILLVEDADNRHQVEAILEKQNKTWEFMMHTKPDHIHQRVQRYCPPPDVLVPQIKALITGWQDAKCSLDPSQGPLFSIAAHKQAKGLIRTAQLGLISDPPGYALYYKMGIDRDGLPYYRCIRGTNSIEGGIHMAICRAFGSLRGSPELSDALLCNIQYRRNATVGHFNQTGKQWNSHYDDWIRDEIVELAADVGVKPSFEIPDVLATRIVTNETFGIIPVPDALVMQYKLQPVNVAQSPLIPLSGDTPVHLLTRLSTRHLSSYTFLAERQRTMHAVVPVHTYGEYNLFRGLMESGLYYTPSDKAPAISHTARTVDFEKLAARWNEMVDERATTIMNQVMTNKIYYKLPEQLERHYKLWLQARGTRATLVNTAQARSQVSQIISDPAHTSLVLPAILLAPVKPIASWKGKEKAVIPDGSGKNIAKMAPNAPSGLGSSAQHVGGSSKTMQKKKAKKHCYSCKVHNCSRTNDCKGSGGRRFCKCLDHPILDNPRAHG